MIPNVELVVEPARRDEQAVTRLLPFAASTDCNTSDASMLAQLARPLREKPQPKPFWRGLPRYRRR